jgi:hypothetical protein
MKRLSPTLACRTRREIAVRGRPFFTILGSAVLLFLVNARPAAAGTLTLISPPGAISSVVIDFDGRTVGGYYSATSADLGFGARGYIYDVATATYLTFDLPGGAGFNAVSGTTVVGTYPTGPFSSDGYLYDAATSRYTPLQVPGATSTYAADISGNYVAGDYWLGDYHNHPSIGFLYDGSTYTTLIPPGEPGFDVRRVDGNTVLGQNILAADKTYGILYDIPTSTYTPFAPPGAVFVDPEVLHDGLVAGTYSDFYNGSYHGHDFLYDIATASFPSINVPGPIRDADGNNLVGNYDYDGRGHPVGYLYSVADGTYISFGVAGATSTNFDFVSGDTVAGVYTENVAGTEFFHAFVVESPTNTPPVPEPSTLFLAATASALLAGYAVRHIMRSRAEGKAKHF